MSDVTRLREPSIRHLGWYVGTALHSVGRHPWVFALAVALTVAAAGGLVAALPGQYEVRCRLVARNPPRSAPTVDSRVDAPARAAARMVLAEAELLGVVQDTDLVRRWRARRPALSRVKERLLGRPMSDADAALGLARTLEDRIWVTVDREAVITLVVRWTDPDAALLIAESVQRRYLAIWQALEVTSISTVAEILERRTEEARADLGQRLLAMPSRGRGADPAGDPLDRDALLQALRRRRAPRDDEATPPAQGTEQGRRKGGAPQSVRSTIDVDTLLRMRALRLGVPFDTTEPDAVSAAREDLRDRADRDDEDDDDPKRPRTRALGELDPRSARILELARSGLASAEAAYAAIEERLETARFELDTSRGAFDRRYLVVEPPIRPRATVRPARDAVLLWALVDALLVALLATTVVEFRAIRRSDAFADAPPPTAPRGWRRWRQGAGLAIGVAAVGVACLAGVFAGNGSPALALAPFAAALVVAAGWWLPPHETLPAVAFLCLVLENPSEAFGADVWKSPIYIVGALFLQKISVTIPVKALVFSGLDVALVLLTSALVWHRARRSDPVTGRVPTAVPATTAALACLATIAFVWGYGLARGGSFGNSLWQVFRVIYLPCVLLLFSAGLRGPQDAGKLGKVLVTAAVYRALLAGWIRYQFPDTEEVPFATIHADSMLFVDAVALLLGNLLVRPGRRSFWTAAGIVPILFWGMIANNRRLAWVEVAAAMIPVLVLAPWTTLKRRLVQAFVLSLPLLVLYVIAGWGNPTGVFAPVRTIRSLVDSKSDGSTQWRDWENYNIAFTARQNPLIGSGFGHGYDEVVLLPDISRAYALYRYAPHNSVLGLLAYAGIVGFAGLWMMLPIGIMLAVRAYRRALLDRDRVAMLACMSAIISYIVHCYGDMGLGTWASVFTVAPAIVLAAKTATATGAWPRVARRA